MSVRLLNLSTQVKQLETLYSQVQNTCKYKEDHMIVFTTETRYTVPNTYARVMEWVKLFLNGLNGEENDFISDNELLRIDETERFTEIYIGILDNFLKQCETHQNAAAFVKVAIAEKTQ